MNEKIMKALDEVGITLEMTLRDVNALLNILNMPQSSQCVLNAMFIQEIQRQASPQAEKAKATIEAIHNSDGVPKDLEERN